MVHDNNATVNQVSLLATTLSYELEDSVVAQFYCLHALDGGI